jgi:hypothetical protein
MNLLLRILITPLFLLLAFAYLHAPVFTLLLSRPWLILDPRIYYELLLYLAIMSKNFFKAFCGCFMHFVPPSFENSSGENFEQRKSEHQFLLIAVKKEKLLQFEVMEKESYDCQM